MAAMSDHISIKEARLSGVLNELRRSGATTAVTIESTEKVMDGFHSNRAVKRLIEIPCAFPI